MSIDPKLIQALQCAGKHLDIRILRERLSLSPEALAALLKVSVKSIVRWEMGFPMSRLAEEAIRRLLEDLRDTGNQNSGDR